MSIKIKSTILAFAAITAMLPTAFGWSPAFYDQPGCNDANNFDYVVYSGSGSALSSCQVVGSPGNNCEYFTDGGDNSSPCTGPFQNPAQSVGLPKGTKCSFFTDTACQNSAGVRQGVACANVARQSIDTPRSFMCQDV